MKKFISISLIVLFFITCKKSSTDPQSLNLNTTPADAIKTPVDSNSSLIGKWQLYAYQSDGGSGDVSWHPADTLNNGYIIFKSDSLIFETNLENDTALYKITEPGVIYLYRGKDSFRIVYQSSPTLLYFSSAYCSEACGEKYVPVH
jgi:hypothetical protein